MQSNGGPMAAVFAAPGKYIQGRSARPRYSRRSWTSAWRSVSRSPWKT
jgi:hypothetical protein